MAIPSFRSRVGAIEIKNRKIKESEERKRKLGLNGGKIISKEEHKKRLDKLKRMGVIKDGK